MSAIMHANEWLALPPVITKPGDYTTRGGDRASIHSINDSSTFSAKGSIWRMYRGAMRPRGFHIWHPNGRNGVTIAGSSKDIVGLWIA